MHELMTKLGKSNAYFWTEVEMFADAFLNPKMKLQGALHAQIKPAFDRFADLEEEEQDMFRKDLMSFIRLYKFLSQIVPYAAPELEKLFVFGKSLLPRLAEAARGEQLSLDLDVKLTHYRLQKLGEQALDLEKAEVLALPGISAAGTGAAPADKQKELREIVSKMNDLFSGEIRESDFLGAITAWQGHLMANENLAEQAKNNSEEQFSMGDFRDAFMDVVIDAKDASNSIADQLLKDERTFGLMQQMLAKAVWRQFQPRR